MRATAAPRPELMAARVRSRSMAPLGRLERPHLAPEASALSAELQGHRNSIARALAPQQDNSCSCSCEGRNPLLNTRENLCSNPHLTRRGDRPVTLFLPKSRRGPERIEHGESIGSPCHTYLHAPPSTQPITKPSPERSRRILIPSKCPQPNLPQRSCPSSAKLTRQRSCPQMAFSTPVSYYWRMSLTS